jgi:hypothetical protein
MRTSESQRCGIPRTDVTSASHPACQRTRAGVGRAFVIVGVVLTVTACDRSGDGAAGTPSDSADTASQPIKTQSPESPLSAELRMALEKLLAGSASSADSSWFGERTRGALRSATVNSAGHAIVDFQDLRTLIPNASSSAGSAQLVQELNAAVFAITGIESVEYQMDHSCDVFWEWLQQSCHVVTRSVAP